MVVEESRRFVVEGSGSQVLLEDIDDARRLVYKPSVKATQTLSSDCEVLVDQGETF